MLAHLVEGERLSPEQIHELRAVLDDAERRMGKSQGRDSDAPKGTP
jgi:hypothetical protein